MNNSALHKKILCFIMMISLCAFSSCASTTNNRKELHSNKKLPINCGDKMIIDDIARCASLAPSGHNTQPWKFSIHNDTINIFPDFSRRLPAVDPDDRELYISLGCALENLTIAAGNYGYESNISYNLGDTGNERITVILQKTDEKINNSGLFEQIELRQSTRNVYNGRKVPADTLNEISKIASDYNVSSYITIDSSKIDEVIQLVKAGNTKQFNNEKFMDELKSWIRFNQAEAEEKSDGLSSAAFGNTSAPRWLGKLFMNLFISANSQNKDDEEKIKSSAGIIVFYSKTNDKKSWIETGRVYERYSLFTTMKGIKNAFINQPVEEKELNAGLLKVIGQKNVYPQLMLRFGYSDAMPISARRKLSELLVK